VAAAAESTDAVYSSRTPPIPIPPSPPPPCPPLSTPSTSAPPAALPCTLPVPVAFLLLPPPPFPTTPTPFFSLIRHSATQQNTAQHSATQHNIAQHGAAQHSTDSTATRHSPAERALVYVCMCVCVCVCVCKIMREYGCLPVRVHLHVCPSAACSCAVCCSAVRVWL
jgi:hypothetical protein